MRNCKNFAGFSERRTASVAAHEQLNVIKLFQFQNLLAEVRLHDMEPFGRFRERALLSNRDDELQMSELQVIVNAHVTLPKLNEAVVYVAAGTDCKAPPKQTR